MQLGAELRWYNVGGNYGKIFWFAWICYEGYRLLVWKITYIEYAVVYWNIFGLWIENAEKILGGRW